MVGMITATARMLHDMYRTAMTGVDKNSYCVSSGISLSVTFTGNFCSSTI